MIFSVYTNVEFIRKPDWLDDYFSRHNDQKYDFHVTLKQPCNVTADQVTEIKTKLQNFIEQNNPTQFTLDFNRLIAEGTEQEFLAKDACILIASNDKTIIRLQQNIIKLLENL